MTTDTINQNIDMSFASDYKAAAAAPERLAPERYYVDLPSTLTATTFSYGGRTGIQIDLGQMRIVADANAQPVTGFVNRFYNINTLFNGDDVIDFVRCFTADEANPTGVDVTSLTGATLDETLANWNNLLETIAGQRSPVAIRFGYEGKYKHPLTQKNVYKNSKDFVLPNGSYAAVGYVVDNEFTLTPRFPDDVKDPKAQSTYAKAQGWLLVYANFVPGKRAWATKK